MKKNEKKKFLFLIMEKCEAVDPEVRLKASRVLLYLVQGTLIIIESLHIINLATYRCTIINKPSALKSNLGKGVS